MQYCRAESEASLKCDSNAFHLSETYTDPYIEMVISYSRLLFTAAATIAVVLVVAVAITVIVVVVVVVVVVVTPLRFQIYRSIDLGTKKGKYAHTHTQTKQNPIKQCQLNIFKSHILHFSAKHH